MADSCSAQGRLQAMLCQSACRRQAMKMFCVTMFFLVATTQAQWWGDSLQNGRCRTPDGEPGECVPISRCGPLLNLLRAMPRPQGAADHLRRSVCSMAGNVPIVCCGKEPVVVAPPPTKAPTTKPYGRPPRPGAGSGSRGSNSSLLPTDICGLGSSERIFGGKETDIDEYPWLALLQYAHPDGRKLFLCGGVLINKRYVLTAAHCVSGDTSNFRLVGVRLGEYNLDTEKDCVQEVTGDMSCADPPQDFRIDQQLPHPEYSKTSRNQHHDIALLRLSADAKFNDFVKPICLPEPKLRSKTYVGEELVVAGWGKTETDSASAVKLKVAVPVLSNSVCGSKYNSQRLIVSSQMCAGGRKGQDSCTGDSGGPLMGADAGSDGVNRHYVTGVVSYGPRNCGQEGWPGVYTRVANYMDWIVSQLKP